MESPRAVQRSTDCHPVIIAGGGPAGLAAGLFLARYGLQPLIFNRGKSSLRQCAYLENYLGFAGGLTVADFLARARAHAADAGCRILADRVHRVERAGPGPGRFLVHTRRSGVYRAERFVAATTYDAEYLRALDAPSLFDAHGGLRHQAVDAHGRTAIEGLYLAGPLAGVESEAQIAAGHAAQAALGLIRDLRREQGLWDAIAHYLDWQVQDGVYERRNWIERVQRYFRETLPAGEPPDPEAVSAAIERWIRERRARQLDRAEVERRARRGRRLRARLQARAGPAGDR